MKKNTTPLEKKEPAKDELMYDDYFEWNNYLHFIKVYGSGKVLIEVKTLLEVPVKVLDYPSLESLKRFGNISHTLVGIYIGKKFNEYIEKIENAIFN